MGRLDELNIAAEERAVVILEPLIERAPEIARRVARHRPFSAAEGISQAIRSELLKLETTSQIDLFRAHPELAPDNPLAMTCASQQEQGRLNLTSDRSNFRIRLADLNARYATKFGFPFITALVRHNDINSVLAEFEARLGNSREQEIQQAIDQICHVSSSRVQKAFGENSADASRDAGAQK